MNILVSACLMDVPCRYSGDGADFRPLSKLLEDRPDLHPVPLCPEQLGGLPTPRPPAERRGERVVTQAGGDVTEAYRRGGEAAVRLARRLDCRCALMKARSPSCGSGTVYDGTFTHTRIPGDGVAAAALKGAGIPVFDEEHFGDFLNYVNLEGRV